MYAIPRNLSGEELSEGPRYKCPLCRFQRTGDEADTGWVKCPLVDERAICLGCCIDYQSVARSDDFEHSAYKDLFTILARDRSINVSALRKKCMDHQLEVIDERLAEGSDDHVELERLRSSILAVLSDFSMRFSG